MKSIEQTISDSIRFDNFVTGNAQRILENLREEGYEVVPRGEGVDLPELMRVFGKTQVSAEQAEFWIREAFNSGAKSERDHPDLARLRAVEEAAREILVAGTASGCREWIDTEEGYNICWAPAEFVLWGKLLKPEALGPRCYDHAAKHVGHRALGDSAWAIIDLRSLRSALSEPAAEGSGE